SRRAPRAPCSRPPHRDGVVILALAIAEGLTPSPGDGMMPPRPNAPSRAVLAVVLGLLAGTWGAPLGSARASQLQGGIDLSGSWSSNWGDVLLQHSQVGVSGTWLQPAGMGACPATSP